MYDYMQSTDLYSDDETDDHMATIATAAVLAVEAAAVLAEASEEAVDLLDTPHKCYR